MSTTKVLFSHPGCASVRPLQSDPTTTTTTTSSCRACGGVFRVYNDSKSCCYGVIKRVRGEYEWREGVCDVVGEQDVVDDDDSVEYDDDEVDDRNNIFYEYPVSSNMYYCSQLCEDYIHKNNGGIRIGDYVKLKDNEDENNDTTRCLSERNSDLIGEVIGESEATSDEVKVWTVRRCHSSDVLIDKMEQESDYNENEIVLVEQEHEKSGKFVPFLLLLNDYLLI